MRNPTVVLLLSLLILTIIRTHATQAEEEIVERQAVKISYDTLREAFDDEHCVSSTELETACQQAFGPDGLGFLEVTDIPSDMVALRTRVLHMARDMAQLPNTELDSISLPDAFYTIGWSHGKEQFRGTYDTQKASFYFNPFDNEINVYPNSMQPNLEDSLLEVTHFMKQVGLWVAKLCDTHLNKKTILQDSLDECRNAKARLLYYFPSSKSAKALDDWCGWHKDHGSLTVLLPGLIFGDSDDSSYSKAGLYIQTSKQEIVHMKLPSTSVGIQMGETVEIQSGGQFRATPHAVKSSTSNIIGRASLALFLQPLPDQPLPELYNKVNDESLKQRWRPTFGDFQKATTQAFN